MRNLVITTAVVCALAFAPAAPAQSGYGQQGPSSRPPNLITDPVGFCPLSGSILYGPASQRMFICTQNQWAPLGGGDYSYKSGIDTGPTITNLGMGPTDDAAVKLKNGNGKIDYFALTNPNFAGGQQSGEYSAWVTDAAEGWKWIGLLGQSIMNIPLNVAGTVQGPNVLEHNNGPSDFAQYSLTNYSSNVGANFFLTQPNFSNGVTTGEYAGLGTNATGGFKFVGAGGTDLLDLAQYVGGKPQGTQIYASLSGTGANDFIQYSLTNPAGKGGNFFLTQGNFSNGFTSGEYSGLGTNASGGFKFVGTGGKLLASLDQTGNLAVDALTLGGSLVPVADRPPSAVGVACPSPSTVPQIAWDNSYFYVCTPNGTMQRMGSDLPVSASDITTGTLPANVLPNSGINASSITTGFLSPAVMPLSGISANAITSGTLPASVMPATGISASSITGGVLPIGVVPTGIPANYIGSGGVTNTQYAYLSNVRSDIQAQIDALTGQVTKTTTIPPNANLSGLTSALASASSQVVNVVVFGDSLTSCWGAAGTTTTDCPGIGPTNQSSLWINQLKSYLQGKYGNHGTGLIQTISGIGQLRNSVYSVSPSNGYSILSGIGPSQGGVSAGGAAVQLNAGSILNVSSQTGDALKIYYATYSTFSQGGFSVSVDGVNKGNSFGTENTPNAATSHVTTITGIGSGGHTVAISCNASGTSGAACYISGVEFTIGTSGVSVHNLGVGACRSDCFGSNPSVQEAFSDLISGSSRFDVIALGTNDYLHGSLGAFTTNMGNLISHEKGLGLNDLMIANLPWTNGASADGNPETAYNSAMNSMGANDVFDVATALVSYSSEASNGYINSDGIHLSDAGQQFYGAQLQTHVFGGSTTTTTSSGGGTVSSGAGLPSNITFNPDGGFAIATGGIALSANLNTANGHAMIAMKGDQQEFRLGTSGSGQTAITHNAFFLFDPATGALPIQVFPGSDNVSIGDTSAKFGSPSFDPGNTLTVLNGSNFATIFGLWNMSSGGHKWNIASGGTNFNPGSIVFADSTGSTSPYIFNPFGALILSGTNASVTLNPGGPGWSSGSGNPGGGCPNGSLYSQTSSGQLFVCQGGSWVGK